MTTPSYLLLFSSPYSSVTFRFVDHCSSNLFMQDPSNISAPTRRKPWYRRAMEMANLWKISLSKTTEIPLSNPLSTKVANRQKLKKSTSLNIATRVCLCVPISSYTDVFQADVAPRRSNTYPRSKPFPSCIQDRPRISTQGRRIFRGKSLMDDVLMRRFVVEEEAMMQVRRRNEMEVIRRSRNAKRRRRLGPSPLSRMVLAQVPEE